MFWFQFPVNIYIVYRLNNRYRVVNILFHQELVPWNCSSWTEKLKAGFFVPYIYCQKSSSINLSLVLKCRQTP